MAGKPQYAGIEKFVLQRSPVWQDRLGLSHFEIEHTFLDSFEGTGDGQDDFKVTAVCETRWNYLEAKIKWYLPSAARHSLEHLEGVLVHELCHVLLAAEQNHLPDRYSEQLELTTEMVSRALLNAWKET